MLCPVVVRMVLLVVPAVVVKCSPPFRSGVDGLSSFVNMRVFLCVVPATFRPPRSRLGVGGVSSPVLVSVLVCVAPAAECPPRFRVGAGSVSSPALVRVLRCVVL